MGNDVPIIRWEKDSEGRSPEALEVERDLFRDFELTSQRG
jgi:hypothetical protein